MSLASNEIVSMQNQSAYNQADSKLNGTAQTSSTDDSNMFLTLMLQQLQNQDPTQPTDNTEWLAQLAQYSTLEQMTQMNQGLEDCMSYLSALYSDLAANAEITQSVKKLQLNILIQKQKKRKKLPESLPRQVLRMEAVKSKWVMNITQSPILFQSAGRMMLLERLKSQTLRLHLILIMQKVKLKILNKKLVNM